AGRRGEGLTGREARATAVHLLSSARRQDRRRRLARPRAPRLGVDRVDRGPDREPRERQGLPEGGDGEGPRGPHAGVRRQDRGEGPEAPRRVGAPAGDRQIIGLLPPARRDGTPDARPWWRSAALGNDRARRALTFVALALAAGAAAVFAPLWPAL